jgi:23S rRNA pseudouridine2605 synthase
MKSGAKIRLNSYLAQCGLGSRRKCEQLIVSGKVAVDGAITRELATQIDPGSQNVSVHGKPVRPAEKIYLLFHKPTGFLCTRASGDEGKTIFDLLPAQFQNLFNVGRLDRDTEGLLFLTNDGAWADRIAHPRNEVEKVYVAEVHGRLDRRELQRVVHGVRDEGELLRAESVRVMEEKGRGQKLQIVLREGKKREIRRLFRALHHPVVYLKRLEIGGVKLGDLPVGKWRKLREAEVRRFTLHASRSTQL